MGRISFETFLLMVLISLLITTLRYLHPARDFRLNIWYTDMNNKAFDCIVDLANNYKKISSIFRWFCSLARDFERNILAVLVFFTKIACFDVNVGMFSFRSLDIDADSS